MIKRYYVRINALKPGMRIDQAIKDRLDRTLVAKGSILDEFTIDGLKKRGISGVYISEGEEEPEPEKEEIPISPVIRNTISKLRKEDPAKVSLSESVKKRISTGIQYLYSLSLIHI